MPLSGTDRSFTAGAASAQVIAPNTSRTRMFLKNDTAIDVWLHLGSAASATPGGGNIKLAAGDYWDHGDYTGAVHAISGGANADITAWEL